MSFRNGNDQIFFGFEILKDRGLMYARIIRDVGDSPPLKTAVGNDTLRMLSDKSTFSVC